MKLSTLSRRRMVTGLAGVTAATILRRPAHAAEFSYKLGASSPMEHPAMLRTKEAADKLREITNGRLDIIRCHPPAFAPVKLAVDQDAE